MREPRSRDGPTTTQRTMIDSSPMTHGGGNCGPMFDDANVSFFVISYDNKKRLTIDIGGNLFAIHRRSFDMTTTRFAFAVLGVCHSNIVLVLVCIDFECTEYRLNR